MTGLLVTAGLVLVLIIVPALLGLVFERVRGGRPRAESLMTADRARARAALIYYNEVHDSTGG